MPENLTLEQAMERIVELTEQNQQLTTERDTLSQNNTELSGQCEELRKLNQKYFNKLIAQEADHEEGKKQPDPVPSCEDFAKTLI